MPDITAISAALTSMRTSTDLAKAMLGLRDANLVREKAFELTAEIMSAQQSTLSAQAAQAALLQEVRDLKEQIRQFERWDAEASHYKLTKLASGALAYASDPNRHPPEPEHYLCAHCFQARRKSILQPFDEQAMYRCDHMLRCDACKAVIMQSQTRQPPRL